jgi:hypothetical protein
LLVILDVPVERLANTSPLRRLPPNHGTTTRYPIRVARQGLHDTLTLTMRWPFGRYAVNPDPESLLFRPYRRLATSGAPTGTFSLMFLNAAEPLPPSAAKGFRLLKLWDAVSPTRRHPIYQNEFKLLGSLCYTPGGMLLFFPGYRSTFITGYTRQFTPTDRRDNFIVDHFSLEPNMQRWHISGHDGTHLRGFGVLSLPDDVLFWFAMTVQAASEFEPIYRRSRWTFHCPDTDSRRRHDDVLRAREDSVFNIIECPDATVDDGPSLWHFEFTVKRDAVESPYPTLPLHFPPEPLARINPSTRLSGLPLRSHRIQLPTFNGSAFVSTTRISGTLSVPVLLLMAPQSAQTH